MKKLKVCAVIIDNTTRSFDRIYYYQVPHELESCLETGKRIHVPFGRNNTIRIAYFLDFVSTDTTHSLKCISDVIDETSIMSKELFRLAQYMRKTNFATYSQAIQCMTPAGLKLKCEKYVIDENDQKILIQDYMKSIDFDQKVFQKKINEKAIQVIQQSTPKANAKYMQFVRLKVDRQEIIDRLEEHAFHNEKQIRLMELLLEYGELAISELQNYEQISRSIIKNFEKKGFLVVFEKQVERKITQINELETTVHDELLPEQKNVIKEIEKPMKKNEFNGFLLHGVTGSGKTEVYLQLARTALEQNKSIIILVPEIALTPLMIRRFMGRFGDNVAVLHSRLSMGERLDQWKKLQQGKAKIALGARSCVFAPVKNLGLVIIDEEHETSYLSENTPKYDAREMALFRCKDNDAVLVLGSATPSIDTYHYFEKHHRILEMKQSVFNKYHTDVQCVDMREELKNGNRSIFSEILKNAIQENIQNKNQTLLFVNRRGYASFFLCRECGESIMCPNCDVTLTYHKINQRMVCHYCGYAKRPDTSCPSCHSSLIKDFGIGTQKVEEEVHQLFPQAKTIRMDLDTTGYKNSHMEILDRFKNENLDILIGTQMIAKGHDFPNITLVGVLAADALIHGDSFSAQERGFQLITQSIGRTGRDNRKSQAIVQAYDMENMALQTAVKQDYGSFYQYEIQGRKQLGYPPFGWIGKIIFSSKNQYQAKEWAEKCVKMLEKEQIEVSKAAFAPVSRIKNVYRYRVIVKSNDHEKMDTLLQRTYHHFTLKCPKSVLFAIETQGTPVL